MLSESSLEESRSHAHHPPPGRARRTRRPGARRPAPRGRAGPDLFEALRPLYDAESEPSLVEVPTMHFLMIDGHGDPSSGGEFREAMEALFPVAFTLKFAERAKGVEYGLLPIEALWWTDEGGRFDVSRSRETWRWTAMLAIPRVISWDDVDEARMGARHRHPFPAIDRIHLGSLTEGSAAQVLHRGPYSTEGPTIAWLRRFIERSGLRPIGKHHEIYLSDPRRAAPDRVRTILRQPVHAL